MNKEEKQDYEAECEDCPWKGNKEDMVESDDEDGEGVDVCPDCGSDNIYYLK